MDEDISELLDKLTLEEQISLLSGADFWRTATLPHHGIPSIKTTDGPSGARGEFFDNGTPAALFPCGISLASTWDLGIIEEVGRYLGRETKARAANVLLAPTVNIHRSPLGGRNFESFSEDPLLTGKIAAAYIRGVQSEGVAATIKHFVANEQETNRMIINSVVDERTLREIYLKPFEIALRESNPWALMSSYNQINGVPADANEFTLQRILRDEWKFDGTVISDWTALKENTGIDSVRAGCDLEMPGPTKWRGEYLLEAVMSGQLSRVDIERAASNVLKLVQRTKGLDNLEEERIERRNDTEDQRKIIRRAGSEGIVLLKNENNLLPIKTARKIAVIGPNAKRCIAGGGGSAKVNPYYLISPFEGIEAGTDAEIVYAQGCESAKWLPLASNYCRTKHGGSGVTIEYFKGCQFEDSPASVQHKASTDLYLWDSAPKVVLPDYSFRVKTTLKPRSTGEHTISFSSVGPGRLFLDGELFIDNWDWTREGEAMFGNSDDVLKTLYLEIDKEVELLVESTSETRPRSKIVQTGAYGYGGCRIGYQEASEKDLLQEASKVAAAADVAVVIVGLDNEWESEGYDRSSMDLPKNGSQDRLVRAISKANSNTVIINQSGSPVCMPWADEVPSVLQTWYQGQETGNAIADVLFGQCNPGGKLPTTFPKQIEDTPAFGNWPGNDSDVSYEEGVFVGYRHYDRAGIASLFPFGHGLSYTTFAYSDAEINRSVLEGPSDILTVSLTVTNTGQVAGAEVVQLYIWDNHARVPRPQKELKAFQKVFLGPGQEKVVQLLLDKHSVGYFDPDKGLWVAAQGAFMALVGSSSADIRTSIGFEVKSSFDWLF